MTTKRRVQTRSFLILNRWLQIVAVMLAFGVNAGFGVSNAHAADDEGSFDLPPITLAPGDELDISFPGTPDLLSAPQVIRRDGMITLSLIGEVRAAGLTPAALKEKLLKLYQDQLVVNEITLTVVSSPMSIYVTGGAIRSVKIDSLHPLTALQAVIEAGVEYSRANLKAVVIIRYENGKKKRYEVNLQRVLDDKEGDAFWLKSGDVVFVKERMF